jgi:hypothetical protein
MRGQLVVKEYRNGNAPTWEILLTLEILIGRDQTYVARRLGTSEQLAVGERGPAELKDC